MKHEAATGRLSSFVSAKCETTLALRVWGAGGVGPSVCGVPATTVI